MPPGGQESPSRESEALANDTKGVAAVRTFPRERFTSEVKLTPDLVSAYAVRAGDTNPVHHDPSFAAGTRYGRPIASGAHTTALLLGDRKSTRLNSSHLSEFRMP